MKKSLNANELYYRRVTTAVGVAMLVFLLLVNGMAVMMELIAFLLPYLSFSREGGTAVYQVLYATGYLLSFMLPAAVLKSRIKHYGYLYHPMKTDIRLSPHLFSIVVGGIVLIWTQAYINAGLVSIFDYSSFSSSVLWGETDSHTALDVVIQFLVGAMVPAFCEEFLFRGAILENCLPFGRGRAILISALLFGVMHQNAEQILYAFAAGVLLGIVYERTGSVWNCTFLHLVNNFLSFAMMLMADKLGGRAPGAMNAALEAGLCMVGFVCIAFLVVVFSERKQHFAEGVFGRSVPASDAYASCPVSPQRAFKLFLSFPNVLFFVFSGLQILVLIGSAILYNYAS